MNHRHYVGIQKDQMLCQSFLQQMPNELERGSKTFKNVPEKSRNSEHVKVSDEDVFFAMYKLLVSSVESSPDGGLVVKGTTKSGVFESRKSELRVLGKFMRKDRGARIFLRSFRVNFPRTSNSRILDSKTPDSCAAPPIVNCRFVCFLVRIKNFRSQRTDTKYLYYLYLR